MPRIRLLMSCGVLLALVGSVLGAQEGADRTRGPRFLFAMSSRATPVEMKSAPILRRQLSVQFVRVPLPQVLAEISRQTNVRFVYKAANVPVTRLVSLRADDITLAAALTQVLLDTDLDVVFSPSGQASLESREPREAVAAGVLMGRVTERGTNAPIASVQVSVAGLPSRYTDDKGQYQVANVPPGDHLLAIRRVGFTAASRRVRVGDGETVTADFTMERAATILTEVVTTASGDRSRLEVGNAIGTIKVDSLVPTTLIRNMSDLLTARTPGVIVSNTTGMVGAPSKIRIRGVNSMQLNNDPIVIVDGVRLLAQSTYAASQTGTGGINNPSRIEAPSGGNITGGAGIGAQAPSRLDDLDPNTIESIDVLRGPSAASLYGTEAANGVIVIKTKRGGAGAFRFNLLADQGSSHIPGDMPLIWFAWGHNPSLSQTSFCVLFHAEGRSANETSVTEGTCIPDSTTAYNPANDPDLTTIGTGSARNLSASLAGGSDRLQEFLSGRMSNSIGLSKMSAVEERRVTRTWGTAPPSWMKRPNTEQTLSGTSRTTIHPASAFDLSLNVTGVYRDILAGLPGLAEGAQSAPPPGAFVLPPRGHWDTLQYLPAEVQRTRMETFAKRGYTSASATYQPAAWVTFRGTMGGDYTLRTDDGLNRSADCTKAIDPLSECRSGHINSRTETFVTTADVGGQLSIPLAPWLTARTAVGEQISRTRIYGLSAQNSTLAVLAFGTDLLSPAPIFLPNAPAGQQIYTIQERRDASATAGWYVEQTAAIRERFFLTGALRQDAASAFGVSVNKKAPVYPKVGLSWLLSDEPFFPAVPVLRSVRLRTAYGHSGNQATQSDILNSYTQGQALTTEGVTQNGIFLSTLGNPELKPERTKEWEGGLDLSLFDNERVHVEGTLYRKVSQDAITSITHPPSLGISTSLFFANNPGLTQRINLGSIENRGVELSINARIVERAFGGWELTVNYSQNQNKLVTKAAGLVERNNNRSWSRNREGYPVFGRWGYQIIAYGDLDGDGLLSAREAAWTDTVVYFGAPFPKSELTWLQTITLFHGALRVNATVDQVNGLSNSMPIASPSERMSARGWTDPTAPLAMQAQAYQALRNSAFISAADVVRLSECSVTYTAPSILARRLFRVRSAAVTFAGRNVALWTNYRNSLDPNVDTSAASGVYGFNDEMTDSGAGLPQPRNWTLRLNLGL